MSEKLNDSINSAIVVAANKQTEALEGIVVALEKIAAKPPQSLFAAQPPFVSTTYGPLPK